MSKNTHISYFKVENFKRFESFEMKNIGQFNLIVGDNNVGKTTVLEALLFDENPNKFLWNLFGALLWRNIHVQVTLSKVMPFYINVRENSRIIEYQYKYASELKTQELSYEVVEKNNLDKEVIESIIGKLQLNPNKNELFKKTLNNNVDFDFVDGNSMGWVPFLSINAGYADDMIAYYSTNIQTSLSLKKALINDLKLFIPTIWDIEISSTTVEGSNFIIARLESYDRPLPITMLGEGSVKLLRILLEISMCQNGRLMIDEIDTGIYHGRFKKFWKIILLSAKRNNVQLFATTHSQECLKFIKEVLEEDDELNDFQKDMRCFRLVEQKDKSVKSYCYDYEKFQFAIDHENEIR